MSDFREWATTPPMGWNSWDAFGASVTEAEVRANAVYMAKNLKRFGYEYVVVDIQWYEPRADSSVYHQFTDLEMDEQSRLMPATNRFPSAKNGAGFKPLADYVHKLGLKFGIHIMRGIPRQAVHRNNSVVEGQFLAREIASNNICSWNSDMYGVDMAKPGAQEYYDSLISLYADWGVDFLKVDDICDSHLYGMHQKEIIALRNAIDQVHRPMVLSLSPGPASLEHGAFLQQKANMWRLTDDFWDTWPQLKGMFKVAAKWAPLVQPGNWPDCDMLPLGAIRQRSVDGGTDFSHTRFTIAEQRTMLTLWSFMKSPLFLGGDLTKSGDELDLIKDTTLLKIHRDVQDSHEVFHDQQCVVWTGHDEQNVYLAYFNTTEVPIDLNLDQFDLPNISEYNDRKVQPHDVSLVVY